VDPPTPSTTHESSPVRPEGNGAATGLNDGPGEGEDLERGEQAGFAAETLAELRKVVWPSRQQLFSESVAVVLMVGLSAAAIAAIDRLYRWIALQVFR
jgi:preprotein translocase subunit SecE